MNSLLHMQYMHHACGTINIKHVILMLLLALHYIDIQLSVRHACLAPESLLWACDLFYYIPVESPFSKSRLFLISSYKYGENELTQIVPSKNRYNITSDILRSCNTCIWSNGRMVFISTTVVSVDTRY